VSQRTRGLPASVDDMDSFDDLGASPFVSVVKVASPDQQQEKVKKDKKQFILLILKQTKKKFFQKKCS
jgi:hypothetical protein